MRSAPNKQLAIALAIVWVVALVLLWLMTAALGAQTLPTTQWSGTGSTAVAGSNSTVVTVRQPWLFLMGDSKTAAPQTWPAQLQYSVQPAPWWMANAAVSGRSTQTTVDNLTAALAITAITATPTVLLNLGANDFPAATFNDVGYDVTWRANTLTILDAVRAKWPAAAVYLMRPWSRGNDTKADTLAGWIDTVVAARPNTFVGPDERVFYKGNDDGVTNTTDGIHPTTAGQLAITAAWKAVLYP